MKLFAGIILTVALALQHNVAQARLTARGLAAAGGPIKRTKSPPTPSFVSGTDTNANAVPMPSLDNTAGAPKKRTESYSSYIYDTDVNANAVPMPSPIEQVELVVKGVPTTFEFWTEEEHPRCEHRFEIFIGPVIVPGPVGLMCDNLEPSPKFVYRSDLLVEAVPGYDIDYPDIIGGATPLCMEIVAGNLELQPCDPANTDQHFTFAFHAAPWGNDEVIMYMMTASGTLVDFNIDTNQVSVVKGIDPIPSSYMTCFSPDSAFFPPGREPVELVIP